MTQLHGPLHIRPLTVSNPLYMSLELKTLCISSYSGVLCVYGYYEYWFVVWFQKGGLCLIFFFFCEDYKGAIFKIFFPIYTYSNREQSHLPIPCQSTSGTVPLSES